MATVNGITVRKVRTNAGMRYTASYEGKSVSYSQNASNYETDPAKVLCNRLCVVTDVYRRIPDVLAAIEAAWPESRY